MSKTSRLGGAIAASLLVLTTAVACGEDEKDGPEASSVTAAAEELVQKGLDELSAGDTEAATQTFENALDVDPENVYAHYNLGVIAQQAGDDETAMKRYDLAIAADDEFASALYNKAMLTETSDLDGAVELYQRAVAANPEMAAAYTRLGFALVELGRKDEGEEALSKGISLDPAMAEVDALSYD